MLRNNKGGSLIEILTTLVILTLGILMISRMFSGGFVVLKRGENTTFAARLAEKEMERLTARADTLPLGITYINGVSPSLPGPPLTEDNIQNLRQIIGETVKIPGPRLEQGTEGALVGSVYDLSFGPTSEISAIYSAPLQRRVVDSSDPNSRPWRWLRTTQYGIDYENMRICFRQSGQNRVFVISYSYWTEDRELRTVNGQEIAVPAGSEWIDIPTAAAADFDEIDERSDRVSRGFQLIAEGDAWSNNPYEYKVLNGLLGRIAFNPAGFGFREVTPAGVADLTAHIDYTVYDWGIISERLQVPQNAPYRVRTTLKDIKERGVTITDSGQAYAGIAPAAGSIGQVDMLIVDEGTGTIIEVSDLAGGQAGMATVNFKDGIIDMPESARGRIVRVYYRAEGDWQVQVQKAYERYTRQFGVESVSFREFRLGGTDRDHLLFNLGDAGKTFSVDYRYIDGDGVERQVIGETHRASDFSSNFGGSDLVHIRLNNVPIPDQPIVVRGASLKVRVLWSEGTRVTLQGIRPRWQYFDLDGTLTRRPSLG